MIYGRVVDSQSGAVPGATVTVTNTGTNVALTLSTNNTGYYEANLLLPGTYQVSAEAPGFATSTRKGILLPMSTRTEINLTLQVGGVAESVTVTAEAPLINPGSTASGRILDNKTQSGLPVSSSNITPLARLAPGVQTNGLVRLLDAGDQGSSSNIVITGGVGGPEFTIDGGPNNGFARTAGYLPQSDMIAEMKVETSTFDAAVGHSSGANVTMISKSGSNQFHGSLAEMHVQKRWNAMTFFAGQLFDKQIAAAEAAGDRALAERLRNSPRQPSGRRNEWSGTLGGPVILPKLFNGKDKLFFFFGLSGYREWMTSSSQFMNNTFPTIANRNGDFSQLLNVGPQYQIYDPLSVKPDSSRPGHYIRDPIPGNILPKSRMINPAYNAYLKFLPVPNNDPANPKLEPTNNYIGANMPQPEEMNALLNRMDYLHSSRHRFYARWYHQDYYVSAADWAYESYPGLMASDGIRNNIAGVADWIWTPQASTLIDFNFGINQFSDGPIRPVARKFKPSDIGLPKYLDDHCGSQCILPSFSFDGYSGYWGGSFGFPTITRYTNRNARVDASYITGGHTVRAGVDFRAAFRTGGGGGYTQGNVVFGNMWTRRNDDTFTPAGNLGHSWAAFMMGLPRTMQTEYSDSYAVETPYYAWYVQDTWRITPRLNVTLGLRSEYEAGYDERYNRMLTYFDPSAQLPIAAGAQAAYAKSPVPELSATNFRVAGGAVYAGTNGASRRAFRGELMSVRLASVWRLYPHSWIREPRSASAKRSPLWHERCYPL